MSNLKIGDIVTQKETIITGLKKDNKGVRLSLVLFTEKLGENEFVCSCPLTRKTKTYNEHPEWYCYKPYTLINAVSSSMIKVNDANYYDSHTVYSSGMSLSSDDMVDVITKVRQLGEMNASYYYIDIAKNMHQQLKNRKKEERQNNANQLANEKRKAMVLR